jgi:hypothetical protein
MNQQNLEFTFADKFLRNQELWQHRQPPSGCLLAMTCPTGPCVPFQRLPEDHGEQGNILHPPLQASSVYIIKTTVFLLVWLLSHLPGSLVGSVPCTHNSALSGGVEERPILELPPN